MTQGRRIGALEDEIIKYALKKAKDKRLTSIETCERFSISRHDFHDLLKRTGHGYLLRRDYSVTEIPPKKRSAIIRSHKKRLASGNPTVREICKVYGINSEQYHFLTREIKILRQDITPKDLKKIDDSKARITSRRMDTPDALDFLVSLMAVRAEVSKQKMSGLLRTYETDPARITHHVSLSYFIIQIYYDIKKPRVS